MRKKLFALLLVSVVLAACTEETVLPLSEQEQQSVTRSVSDGVRIVPLKIYMDRKPITRTTVGKRPPYNDSWGEDNELSMGSSVARNLAFYVYSRVAGTSGDFKYNAMKSGELNGEHAWSKLVKREFKRDYESTFFATTEVYFRKNEGEEYKILVTACGEDTEESKINGVSHSTNEQNAEPLEYYTKGRPTIEGEPDIVEGDNLSDLMARVKTRTAAVVPQLKTSASNSNDVSYDTNIPVYGIQECFYGFCESQTAPEGSSDLNIVTYKDPGILRAYLNRNVARVEIKLTNIYYMVDILKYLYTFPWIGIYANNVKTETNASAYDQFRDGLESSKTDEWKLLTFYDETGKATNTISGFGNVAFTGDNAGTFSFVTYMLPSITKFKFRVKWDRQGGIRYKYCHDIEIPIQDQPYALGGGSDGGGTGILVPSVYDKITNELQVYCNRKYTVTVDGNARLQTTK